MVKNRGRKISTTSATAIIIKELLKNRHDNVDGVARAIVQRHKKLKYNNIRYQIRNILSLIRLQKGKRWKQYTLNEYRFVVRKKK